LIVLQCVSTTVLQFIFDNNMVSYTATTSTHAASCMSCNRRYGRFYHDTYFSTDKLTRQ